MAEFENRPEITVSTMGKVHNPSGKGVPIKIMKNTNKKQVHADPKEQHATVTSNKIETKRNITRKKSANDNFNYDNKGKKQGGHGKGAWNSHDDVLDEYADVIDKSDPLYDEQEDAPYVLVGAGVHGELNGTKTQYRDADDVPIYGALYTETEFKHRTEEIIRELYDSGDFSEVITSLNELGCPQYAPLIIKRALSLSLDHGSRERELTSQLLCELASSKDEANFMSRSDIERGFEICMDGLPELTIDCPDARHVMQSYLARAVVDEVLSPAYLRDLETSLDLSGEDGELQLDVVRHAMLMLSREHCTARLEHVWGPGDGNRTVEELKGIIDQLLNEYLLSLDLEEATRCVQELNAPLFHHELVKRAIKISLEHTKPNSPNTSSALDAMVMLIVHLSNESDSGALLSPGQIQMGLKKFHGGYMEDMALDVPGVHGMFECFCRRIGEDMQGKVDVSPYVGSSVAQ